MARTELTPFITLGPKSSPYTAGAADITMTAADVANKNQGNLKSQILVFAHNTGAGAQTVTISSVADPAYGRTGDVSAYSLAAGDYAVFGPFTRPGWGQDDGKIYLEADSADVKLALVQV